MTSKQGTPLGMIGLGLLGSAIARRLIACGHRVVGHDVDATRVDTMQAAGFEAAASPAEVAARCEQVLVCVTHSDAVRDVALGPNGFARASGSMLKVVVDHSTTDIEVTQDVSGALAKAGAIAWVDAPVSGGPSAAEAGTLAIMAGGDAGAIAGIEPIMLQLGRFTHMGPVGAGQATKLVNQALVLTNYCVIAEALRLAQAYGVEAERIPHALETGHAGSNLLPILFERMIAEDFAPRGYARQVLKDLEMLNKAAASQGLALPMAGQALTLFRMLVGQGQGERDGAAVVTLIPRSGDTGAGPR
jgi:3-hydroxyisobutyrate dehydrogenase